MALTAQQYREKAESAANSATANAASDKGISYATVSNAWTYLYEVQSKVDGTITESP